jgi:putative restriction endonuclease
MTELIFKREHAEEAIRQTTEHARGHDNGLGWLYDTYRKPGGQMRKSSTGFLMYQGVAYPVKPLGRFANALAGRPMKDNPITNVFRDRFAKLKFRLIDSPEAEAEQAVQRQRKLAEVLARPQQAKFRREVFTLWGARCLVTKCETLSALEAAHIRRVSDGGGDHACNGIPLRADIHRLFDADLITLSPEGWTVTVSDAEHSHYREFHGRSLAKRVAKTGKEADLAAMLRERNLR